MQISEIKPEDKLIPTKVGDLRIRTISWQDFKGNVDPHLPYSAHIYWTIDYEICYNQKKKKSFVKVDVKILPKSWSLKENRNPHLLMHEYGHYLIGCICALNFQKKVNHLQKQPLTLNMSEWVKKVFKETLDQYLKVQKQYDEQTNHRLNFQKQQEWQKKLIRTLQQYKESACKQKTKEIKVKKPVKGNGKKSNMPSTR